MKSMQERAFEQALFYLNEYNREKKKWGEFHRFTIEMKSNFLVLYDLIASSGYQEDWERFLKSVNEG